MAIVKKLLNSPTHAADVFLESAILINESITIAQLESMISTIVSQGIDIFIEKLDKAIMQAVPYPSARVTIQRPQISFDIIYAGVMFTSGEQVNRQEYLHFVKILHEIAHCLLPLLIESTGVQVHAIASQAIAAAASGEKERAEELATKLNTPEKIGITIDNSKRCVPPAFIGDFGSGWEESVFGGRVLPEPNNKSSPCNATLKLLRREFEDLPPTSGNILLYRIDDAYISNIISQLTAWEPGLNFPDLRIPAEALKTHRLDVMGSIDLVRERLVKSATKRARDDVGTADDEFGDDSDSEDNNSEFSGLCGFSFSAKQIYKRNKYGIKF